MTAEFTQERLERDLRWCVKSPGLIIDPDRPEVFPPDTWFSDLAIHPHGPLPRPAHTHRFRLGLHFEKLFGAWVDSEPAYRVSASNLQVFHGKITVGEFDLVLTNQGQPEHWELAVKFFLGTGDGQSAADWYGPNTADRLDLKYGHLIDHQLKLSLHPDGAAALVQRQITKPLVRGIIKGRLFYPFETYQRGHFPAPSIVNPSHERGWWIHIDSLPEDIFQRTAYLPKHYWLAPLTPADVVTCMNHDELLAWLCSGEREPATHVALLDESGTEISRGFIVTDEWLAHWQQSSV